MITHLWTRTGSRNHRAAGAGNKRRTACHLNVDPLEDRCLLSGDMVLRWNEVMLAAVRVAGQSNPFAARTGAIVQAAVYEAVNAIDHMHTPYLVDIPAPPWASQEAAAAQAAHDALVGLFPAQTPALDLQLLVSLQGIADGPAKTWGINVGHAAAQILLAVRAHDGSDAVVEYTPGTEPGDWQPTPPAYGPPAVPQWPYVTPFALQSGSQFRPGPQPALTSAEYTADFNEVKELGSVDSATRTADQTEAAMFWQGVVTPNAPGWWNIIARTVAAAQGTSLAENARLFALLNLAEADSFIASYDAKYTYNLWRPVTGIRAADTDDNPDTDPDPDWTPLLATPSHPSYVSNHAINSTTSAVVLASFFGTDAIPFSFSWDGLPGVTRSFDSFSAAAREAGLSRIWAGFHWRFDITAGEEMGQAVGAYVFQNYLRPLAGPSGGGGAPLPAPPPAAGNGTEGGLTSDRQPGAAPGQALLDPGLYFAAPDAGNRLSVLKPGSLIPAHAGDNIPTGQQDVETTGDSALTNRLTLESAGALRNGSDPSGLGKDLDLALGSLGFWEGLFDPVQGLTLGV